MDRIFEAYNGDMGAEFMHKTRERLHWVCSQVWGSRVLDVGCSQGVVPIILARMGYAVDGIDINPDTIAFANEQLEKEPADIQSKVTYAATDFGKFVPHKDRTYDVITMTEVLEHLVRPQDFIRKVFSILPEKGRFIVTVPFGINDDPDHRQTFYLTSIYSLLHPLFEVAGVKIFGGWIGLSCRRRAAETKDPPVIPLNLMRQAEEAFFKIERPLRDGTLAVRNQRQALKAEQEKLAEDLRTAEKARLEAEARIAAADATPLRSELADVRGQLSASEGEKQVLQTSLEVERKASAGLQDQVSMLKAMLQFATSRPQDNSQETRLLEYSQEVRDLRTVLDRKRDEIADRAEQIGRLNGRIEYFEEANKRLLAERDKFQSDCESSKVRVIALESEREELRRALEAEAEQYKRASEAAQERLQSTEAELAEKVRILAEVEAKLDVEAKAREESQLKVEELGKRFEAQAEQVASQTAQVKSQAGRIGEMEAELDRRRTWTEQHKRECMTVLERLATVEPELAAKSKALSEAETKSANEEKLHKKLSSEAYNLGKQVAAQTARIKELEEALAAKSKALSEAETKSTNEEKLHKKFSSEAYNLGKEVKAQAERIKVLEAELAAKVRALSAAETKCVAEEKLHKKFSSEAFLLKDLVRVYKKKLAEEKSLAAASAKKFERRLQEESGKRAAVEKEMDKLTAMYDKLKKSKLGRLTEGYWHVKDGIKKHFISGTAGESKSK